MLRFVAVALLSLLLALMFVLPAAYALNALFNAIGHPVGALAWHAAYVATLATYLLFSIAVFVQVVREEEQ